MKRKRGRKKETKERRDRVGRGQHAPKGREEAKEREEERRKRMTIGTKGEDERKVHR